MGTHPTCPSTLYNSPTTLLSSIITPESLSPDIHQKYKTLPFLLKVLSIQKPLSIQAHPDKVLAQKLFKAFPKIYKDGNHKPEMAIALTQFQALVGFKPMSEIRRILEEFKELGDIVGDFKESHGLKGMFEALMKCSPERIKESVKKECDRIEQIDKSKRSEMQVLVLNLNQEFKSDIGCFCALFLNLVILNPGQAIFLDANEPHAYLSGGIINYIFDDR